MWSHELLIFFTGVRAWQVSCDRLSFVLFIFPLVEAVSSSVGVPECDIYLHIHQKHLKIIDTHLQLNCSFI